MHLGLSRELLRELETCLLEEEVGSEFKDLKEALESEELVNGLARALLSCDWLHRDPLTRYGLLLKLALHLLLQEV